MLYVVLSTLDDSVESGKMTSQPPPLQPLNVLNLRSHIEQQVRKAILNGTFKPGERLVETAIAEQLGVSRAPVREALSALEREGIVVNVPRRGYSVIDFTDKDIDEVYSLRLLLEIGALRRAVYRFTEKDLAEMQRVLAELDDAARQKSDPEKIITLDLSFHELICCVADHSRLYSAWNNMRLQTQLLISLTSRTHYDHPEQPGELHQRILDAVLDKDLKRAEATLTDHILDAQRRAHMALSVLRSGEQEQIV
jgi:DNA-binding GntR family transcriptional regulator